MLHLQWWIRSGRYSCWLKVTGGFRTCLSDLPQSFSVMLRKELGVPSEPVPLVSSFLKGSSPRGNWVAVPFPMAFIQSSVSLSIAFWWLLNQSVPAFCLQRTIMIFAFTTEPWSACKLGQIKLSLEVLATKKKSLWVDTPDCHVTSSCTTLPHVLLYLTPLYFVVFDTFILEKLS